MKNSTGKKQIEKSIATDSKTERVREKNKGDEKGDGIDSAKEPRAIDRSVRSITTPPGEPYNDPGLRRDQDSQD
jgi:hypothetical protein